MYKERMDMLADGFASLSHPQILPGAPRILLGVDQLQSRFPHWLELAIDTSRSGYVQLALCLLSIACIAVKLFGRRSRQIHRKSFKPPNLLYYDILKRVLLATALCFWIGASIANERQWPNAIILGYALAIGIVRFFLGRGMNAVLLHQTNFVLLINFLTVIVAEISPLAVVNNTHRPTWLVWAGLFNLFLVIAVVAVSPREWILPADCPTLVQGAEIKPAKEDTCSLLDYYCTFGRINSLIGKGWNGKITTAEFQDLPWNYAPEVLYPQITELRTKHKTTSKTIFMFVRGEIFTSIILAGAFYASELFAPFGLYQLLEYLSRPEEAVFQPYLWLLIMFMGELLVSVTQQAFTFISTRAIIKLKMALTTELYQRAMTSRELDDNFLDDKSDKTGKDSGKIEMDERKSSAGQLANMMSTDIKTIEEGRVVLMIIFGVPIGVVVALIGLYQVVGWPGLVGIAFMLLSSPLVAWIVSHISGQQAAAKSAQDTRISLSSEYLGAIRIIKYFGWENAMLKYLQNARAKELKHFWNINLLYIGIGQAAYAVPVLSVVAVYSLHVGVRKLPLTASVAFTTIRLLEMIRNNFTMMSEMGMIIPRIIISLGRLDRFYAAATPPETYPEGPLILKNVTFRRNKEAEFTLEDVTIDFVQGGLNIVSGPSGSGKTTLLLAIIGETIKQNGSVTRPRDVAFASQTPWLQAQSIRDNVLFNSSYDCDRYEAVLDACCLREDLDELHESDMTDIGENGAALSGGQRARVALARALYSNSTVLLLDDVFSAIDTKTASGLWNKVFCTDLLKGRTVVLVTQQPWLPAQADLAITLDSGKVTAIEQNIGVVRQPRTTAETSQDDDDATQIDARDEGTSAKAAAIDEGGVTTVPEKSEVDEEVQLTGLSGRLIFVKYLLYFGGPIFVCFTVAVIIVQCGAEIGTTLWMSHWVDAAARDEHASVTFYLGIYVAISLGGVILAGTSDLTFARGGWIAGRRLHTELVTSVLGVPLSWFKHNPIGRVINRLSGDLETIDQSLPFQLMMFLDRVANIIMRTGAVTAVLPVFVLPALAAAVLGSFVGELYNRTVLIVKQMVSSSQSPIFSQFSESLGGLTIVRAQSQMPQIFADKLNKLLYSSAKAAATQRECDQWMKFRINTIAALVQVSAGLLALSKQGTIAAGLVGFSLTSASAMSSSILMLVFSMNFLNIEMQSFHRVSEYSKLAPEEPDGEVKQDGQIAYADDLERSIPVNWPQSGHVEFRNVTVRYSPDGPDILKDVNLVFNAGERVAIVGRTGSGKSTLVLSLLRFTHIVSGQILYDGVDITAIPRKRLRHAIATIPQEALIFQGTIASNLDPTGQVPQEQLQKVLDACASITAMQQQSSQPGSSSASIVANEYNGNVEDNNNQGGSNASTSESRFVGRLTLSTPVHTGGSNFSHGQRQVLSLCRVLVRHSRLMLLDEATSSMDFTTDAGIQEVLRNHLSSAKDNDRCLITIAHRLRTIADYDKIVVLGAGKVLEEGRPQDLFEKDGVFRDMVMHSGEKGLFTES
ncbi:hypothetical protein QQS21_004253 [Conoideocrella luteorostrata]|uniref:ABC transporter n=1 Tax=Conoideocrella luteorostrata TaxID=1105319 RepID=A0AAJ0CRR0_9HYPO|nr:hypothetical protein QQS21_004253 [Conoideocrella luteorostrata]